MCSKIKIEPIFAPRYRLQCQQAPVVQWIELWFPVPPIGVRIPSGAQMEVLPKAKPCKSMICRVLLLEGVLYWPNVWQRRTGAVRHMGLLLYATKGDRSKLQQSHVARIRLIISRLNRATEPEMMNQAGYYFHALKGDLKGFYSVRVSGN